MAKLKTTHATFSVVVPWRTRFVGEDAVCVNVVKATTPKLVFAARVFVVVGYTIDQQGRPINQRKVGEDAGGSRAHCQGRRQGRGGLVEALRVDWRLGTDAMKRAWVVASWCVTFAYGGNAGRKDTGEVVVLSRVGRDDVSNENGKIVNGEV